MKKQKITSNYTCKISGGNYQYEAEYSPGEKVAWRAHVYQDGELKGSPSGHMIGNAMTGEALRKYVIAYIESVIEKGLDIEE